MWLVYQHHHLSRRFGNRWVVGFDHTTTCTASYWIVHSSQFPTDAQKLKLFRMSDANSNCKSDAAMWTDSATCNTDGRELMSIQNPITLQGMEYAGVELIFSIPQHRCSLGNVRRIVITVYLLTVTEGHRWQQRLWIVHNLCGYC